jgi:hypothetical protein
MTNLIQKAFNNLQTDSRFHVDKLHQSSDRELTGNGTAVSSIFAMYLTYLKNAELEGQALLAPTNTLKAE